MRWLLLVALTFAGCGEEPSPPRIAVVETPTELTDDLKTRSECLYERWERARTEPARFEVTIHRVPLYRPNGARG